MMLFIIKFYRRNIVNDLQRMDYIDKAKGLGIFLVVLGHCYARENFITIWFNSFHMALFL